MVCHGSRSVRRSWAIVFMAGLVGIGLLPTAAAQEPQPEEPPTFELPEIVVPGKRPQPPGSTPARVTVFTRDDLQRLGIRTLGEVLALVSEAAVRSYGGLGALSTVSVRGSTSLGVLVLLDGVPLNDLVIGQTDLSTIPIQTVDQVEILHGSFSGIYGSGAVNGVINMRSVGGDRTRATATGGGYDTIQSSVAGGGTAVRWSVTHEQSGGHRVNSDFTGTTYRSQIQMPTTAGNLEITLHHYRDDLGVPGSLTFATPSARQARERSAASVLWRSEADRAFVRLVWLGEQLHFVDPSFGIDSLDGMTTWRLEGQRYVRRDEAQELVVGGELAHQLLDSVTYGTRRDLIAAGYVQMDRRVGRRTIVSTGLRYDAHPAFGGQWNPRLGVLWTRDERTTVRATLGRAFRVPTYGELFDPFLGNPSLRPERAWSVDVGVDRVLGGGWIGRFTGFMTMADDLIRPDTAFVPQNVAGRVTGLTAEFERQTGDGSRVRLAYTYLEPIDLSLQRDFIYEPRHKGTLTWMTPLSPRASFSSSLVYVGERFADKDNTIRLPSYLTINLAVASMIADGTLTLKVENLFDADYRSVAGYPAPGRTAYVTYALEW